MNLQQKADLKALEQVLLVLQQNATQTTALPNAADTISGITNNLLALSNKDIVLQGLGKLNAQSKTTVRTALELQVLQLAARGLAYAVHIENLVLTQSLKTNKSGINSMSDFIFRDYAQMIHNTLNDEVANIDAIYRITAADLMAFQIVINDFSDVMPGPNNRITRIKVLNQESRPGRTARSPARGVLKRSQISNLRSEIWRSEI